MDPHDDPEARIRELERSLAERSSELGTGHDTGHLNPPPTQPWTHGSAFPPPPIAPWPSYGGDQLPHRQRTSSGSPILLVLGAVTGLLVAGGISAYLMFSTSGTEMHGGGGTITSDPSSPPTAGPTAGPPIAGPTAGPSESATSTAPGEAIIVSGINEHRTIDCVGNAVIVSGIENTLQITGHCTSLSVSGIQNTITIDAADSIGVSGFENRVTFHSGQPEIANSGKSNIVEPG